MQTLVWLRVPGDIVFAAGAVTLAFFAFKLWLGMRPRRAHLPAAPKPAAAS
jgi:nitric oxide reductase subunit B